MTYKEMKDYEEKARNAHRAAYENMNNLGKVFSVFSRCNTVMTEEEYKMMQKAYAELGVALVDARKCADVIEDLNSGDFCCDVLPAIPDVKVITIEDVYN